MSIWKWKKKREKTNEPKPNDIPHVMLQEKEGMENSGNLEEVITYVDHLLGENEDFFSREFSIHGTHSAAMFYISSLVDISIINDDLLKPLMNPPNHLNIKELNGDNLVTILSEEVIYHSEVELETNVVKLVEAVVGGKTVIVIDGVQQMLHIDTRHVDKRAIEQPETEQVIFGPREGFIEQLNTNIGLLRYRLPTADFRVKTLKIGRMTKSKVAVCYLEGTANQALVDEVMRRLSKIDIDGVLDVGYLEEFIEDNYLSPFPQMFTTERPDSTVGNLLEGRVAILVDGSPFSLLAPVTFNLFFQTSEDYSVRFLQGSFGRVIRVLALVFSLVFPALYVALISFNPELLPTEFAIAVAGGRAGVPFPAVIEVLIIEVAMEILREATIRLPQQVGGALSIVGVLVIGDAAVNAGLASPITVVIIALTTIASFTTPASSASFSLRLLRFPLAILAGVIGLYGVMIGIILIINHMLALKSFGVPYMSPVSPGNAQGMKDVVIRSPLWQMWRRPAFLQTPNVMRQKSHGEWGQMNSDNERGEE